MTRDPHELMETYRRAGQAQVFRFFERLSPDGQARLLSEAAEVDLGEIERLVRTLVVGGAARPTDLTGLGPAPYEHLVSNGGDAGQWAKASAAGETALRAGRV